MPESHMEEPWKELVAVVESGNPQRLDEYLDSLSPAEIARATSRLSDEQQAGLLGLLEPGDAADLLEELSDAQGVDLLEELDASRAAAIVDEMETDERADILSELDEEDVEAILREMDPEEAEDVRHLMTYPSDTAGGRMVTDFLVYRDTQRVADVLADLKEHHEEYSDYTVQYAYVTSARDVLIGVVPLRQLVLAANDTLLRSIMIANPLSVRVDAPLEELEHMFDRYPFVGVPVMDEKGRLVGVVRRADAEEAFGERSDKTFMRFSGIIGGEEIRSMPTASRSLRRLSWLVLNMVLSISAACVILFFQDTIGKVFALVFFMPIICNMSGCSGNQAVAVSIREITLGLITPADFVRVLLKECVIGVVNGLVLGVLLALVAMFMWRDVAHLGLIIGAAFALNTLIAVSLGGVVPLLLKRLNIDPAIGAPPMLTTVTDMCGFLLVLGLATAVLL